MIESFDLITVSGDYITVDLLVWRRYKMPAPGIFELTLDLNPHLAKIHATGTPFLPVGTQVRIPIDPAILSNAPQALETVTVYGRIDGRPPSRNVL